VFIDCNLNNNSLSGDQARVTVKQAAETLKDQIRNKMGERTTSSVANSNNNALADTDSAALGGAD
jgi:filamentous hemagglutinin